MKDEFNYNIDLYTETSPSWGNNNFAVDLNAGINEYVFGRTTPDNNFTVETNLIDINNKFKMIGGSKENKDNYHKGSISILGKKYKYKLFNIYELIDLMRKNKQFINSIEKLIRLNGQNDFKMLNLVEKNINIYPNNILYFIIYNNNNSILSFNDVIFNKTKKYSKHNLYFINTKNKKIKESILIRLNVIFRYDRIY